MFSARGAAGKRLLPGIMTGFLNCSGMRRSTEISSGLWGPAFAFDADARRAMQVMVENGYVDGLMAGNALATHDLEGSMFHTALGQDIYTQNPSPTAITITWT